MLSLLLIALATLVSEDLTCIATGVLIAQQKVGFFAGTLACLLGIFFGDLALFLAGRLAFRWKSLSPERIDRASAWLSKRGMAVILISRFTPGLRLPTYFAAGALKTKFWRFSGMFLIASALWTPLLVGATVILGEQTLRGAFAHKTEAFTVLGLALAIRGLMNRKCVGFLKRKVRWEFWPAWAAYIPLVPYLLWLALKHRSFTLFTAANPGMPSGGFVGESKSQILEHLSRLEGAVATFDLLPGSLQRYARIQKAREFMERRGLTFPVVLKPDVGERGNGVAVIRSQEELESYLRSAQGDVIVQQYVDGLEFGVFYYRYPGESRGHICSITEKRFPEVKGDGRSTLAQLILRDPRAVCMAEVYLRRSRRPVESVPDSGESVRLVELGSHCKGAVFLDGTHLKTDALEDAIDRISRCHPGFFFGRCDIRAASVEALRQGIGFKVIELNGVSAEATHIYDPAVSIVATYRVLMAHWRLAFQIGSMNRARGVAPMTLRAFARLIWGSTRALPLRQQSRSQAFDRGPLGASD